MARKSVISLPVIVVLMAVAFFGISQGFNHGSWVGRTLGQKSTQEKMVNTNRKIRVIFI